MTPPVRLTHGQCKHHVLPELADVVPGHGSDEQPILPQEERGSKLCGCLAGVPPLTLTVPSLGWCQVSRGVFLQLSNASALHHVSSARTDEL